MAKMQFIITLSTICMAVIISGCAATSSTPVLEKNAYYQSVGSKQARQDVKQAIKKAKNDIAAVQKEQQKNIKDTTKKTIIAAGVGTAMRIATGSMALGLITGGGTKASTKINEKNQEQKDFRQNVEQGLKQKGYKIKYWKNL